MMNLPLRAICGLLLLLTAAQGYALDPQAHIERSVTLIESEQYGLARNYLAPALIHPQLSASERSRAYYLRGFSYLAQQMYVSARKDFNRALEFNPDNAVVLTELGRLYAEGRGIEQDAALALTLFEHAAQLDYGRAQFHAGHAYLYGLGVDKDVAKAREYLRAAADQNHAFAMFNLGSSYRAPHAGEPQPDIAKAWYEKAHAAGEANALLSIGFMHANGELGAADHARAAEIFRQAMDEGSTDAAGHLAYAYLVGRGVREDHKQAFELYRRAAEAGVVNAFVGLGHVYEHGLGVRKDLAAARHWYERGASANDEDALSRLVSMHLDLDSDEARAEALKWSRAAAALGGAQAQNDYAWLLATSKADALRNGALAVDQAKRAVSVDPSAVHLDTLAAAYAESGDFLLAVAVQREAIALISDDQQELRSDFERRLQYYEHNKPWRE